MSAREFRWKKVGIWDGRPHIKLGHLGMHVLQTRYVKDWEIAFDATSTTPEPVWSDWEDIPVDAS